MTAAEIQKTVLPKFYHGISVNHVGSPARWNIMSLDSETYFGEPYYAGITADGETVETLYGLRKDYFTWIVKTAYKQIDWHACNVLFAHVLLFDLSVTAWDRVFDGKTRKRAPRHTTTIVQLEGERYAEVTISWTRPCFGKIKILHDDKHGEPITDRVIHLVDTFAFFTMKLDAALKMIGSPVQKLAKPAQIGKRLYSEKFLKAYLHNDVCGAWQLGKKITEWCSEYKLKICVSAPQFAGRVFRHHFLKAPIKRPPAAVTLAAMYAYHGGKNSCVAAPGLYKQVREIDITSAYPEAMTHLPNFSYGRWQRISGYQGPNGLYCLSGIVKLCPWGCLFGHDFKKLEGQVSGVWITGWEYQQAMDHKELGEHTLWGYQFLETGQAEPNPFAEFVKEFFGKKARAQSEQEAFFYKLICNSCYGKLIQRSYIEDEQTGEVKRVAGVMFYAPAAALITGYVRAKIHRLEHKYVALHAATDSVKTVLPVDPADMGDALGQLKEVVFGECLILRNKLYVHFENRRAVLEKYFEKHKKPMPPKVGLHGFQGSWEDLLSVIQTETKLYQRRRLTRFTECWHTGQRPGMEMLKEMRLHV